MITREPLVEVAVRQFKDRTIRLFCQLCPHVWRSSGLREAASKNQKPSAMERSCTELRFASFLAPLCGLGGLSRVEMNARKKRAPLTALQVKRRSVLHFCLTRPTT